MTRSLVVVCVAALLWAVAGSAAAQAVRATVLGTVTDRTGGVLPGATVNVTNTETGVVQRTVADSQGRYAVTNLLPAAYNVEASLSGFQTVVRQGIRLVVGSPGRRGLHAGTVGGAGNDHGHCRRAGRRHGVRGARHGDRAEADGRAAAARPQLLEADRPGAGRQRSACGDGGRTVPAVLRTPAAIHRLGRPP